MNILITGASGFIGSSVLSRIGDDPSYNEIYLLIRNAGTKSAGARARELVEKLFSPEIQPRVLKKVRAINGDLCAPHLGLAVRDRWTILDRVDQILHIGASTDFGAPLDVSREYNVEGTRKVLDLAESCIRQGRLKRFDYVSTAYVAGDSPGTVSEMSLERGQSFANNYERSKYEAELLVRQYEGQFPIAIYRPSIVVGDSVTGYTPHFKVLYWPLRLLSKKLLPFVPCDRWARLDVVPVDFVADGLVAIMKQTESTGQTYHLTAGHGHEVKLGKLLKDSKKFARIDQVPLIPFWVFNLVRKTTLRNLISPDVWRTIDLASPYGSYLRGGGARFDARFTHRYLKTLGVNASRWNSYKRIVLSFCTATQWGRKINIPEYEYYMRGRTHRDSATLAASQQ